jgi:indole-3-glycerol phosphate synthase
MRDFLSRMAVLSGERAVTARALTAEADLLGRIAMLPAPRPLRLPGAGFDVIAEVKLRSPSVGRSAPERRDPESTARFHACLFAHAGPSAISVLTEPEAFGGSLAILEGIARAVELPAMRKDFLVDPYQVVEARAYGASGILLIVRLLDDRMIAEMLDAAFSLGLFVLVEAFDRDDLDRAGLALEGRPGIALVGVNARDLTTLRVDPRRFERLASHGPAGVPLVAESGLTGADAAARVAALGYRAALVGEAAMRAIDPVGLLSSMIDAGRAAAGAAEVSR